MTFVTRDYILVCKQSHCVGGMLLGLLHKVDLLTIVLVQVSVLCPIGCDQCGKGVKPQRADWVLLMVGCNRTSERAVKTVSCQKVSLSNDSVIYF